MMGAQEGGGGGGSISGMICIFDAIELLELQLMNDS